MGIPACIGQEKCSYRVFCRYTAVTEWARFGRSALQTLNCCSQTTAPALNHWHEGRDSTGWCHTAAPASPARRVHAQDRGGRGALRLVIAICGSCARLSQPRASQKTANLNILVLLHADPLGCAAAAGRRRRRARPPVGLASIEHTAQLAAAPPGLEHRHYNCSYIQYMYRSGMALRP
jgi:hypothetical protein